MSFDALLFAIAYQLPALLLGLLIQHAFPHPLARAVVLWPGTLVHELLHWIVGFVLNAKPVSMTLLPRRLSDRQWALGSVAFRNVRWYNAVFVGLAPLLAIVAAMLNTPAAEHWQPTLHDLCYWAIAAPRLAMCLPSGPDLRMAGKSWALIVGLGALMVGVLRHPEIAVVLFQ